MIKTFNTIKHGYNPEEVDTYIKTLEDIISEYKEKDTAIRNAIVNAQVAADNIIKNAELEAEEIRKKAKSQLNEIAEIMDLQEKNIKTFQESYNNLLNTYLTKVNENEFSMIYKKISDIRKSLLNAEKK